MGVSHWVEYRAPEGYETRVVYIYAHLRGKNEIMEPYNRDAAYLEYHSPAAVKRAMYLIHQKQTVANNIINILNIARQTVPSRWLITRNPPDLQQEKGMYSGNIYRSIFIP